jgi:hypothetical protein
MKNSLRHRLVVATTALVLAAPALRDAVAATPASAPALRFLSAAEARSALTEGPEKQYFENLQLSEMRAKTGLALTGMSLAAAREQARKHYASEVLEFTPDERAAVEGVVIRLTPSLRQKAPLFARTGWSFLKVSSSVEGGLPHTRGAHIVLSPEVLVPFVVLYKRGRLAELDSFAANLMVHEQSHVVQRQNPALFATLNTEVLGFRRIDPAPLTAWLLERGVVNPDAPDCGWAYPVGEGSSRRWIMPYLLLREGERPRMPQDFLLAGLDLVNANGGWSIVERNGKPQVEPLAGIAEYNRAFPDPSQAYHPNEISADILAGWITGQPTDHPLSLKVSKWATEHLR